MTSDRRHVLLISVQTKEEWEFSGVQLKNGPNCFSPKYADWGGLSKCYLLSNLGFCGNKNKTSILSSIKTEFLSERTSLDR